MPEDNDDNSGQPGNTLREKLEAALKTQEEMKTQLDTLLAENSSLKGSNVLHEAGLSHLSDKQRAAVLKMHDAEEMTKDTILAVAEDLGYKPQAPGQPNPQGNGQDGQGGEQEGQEGEMPTGAQAFINMLQQAGLDTGDPTVTAALNSMSRIEQANLAAQRPSSADFTTKMKNAKSKAELESLIMSEGAAHGLVHEFDID